MLPDLSIVSNVDSGLVVARYGHDFYSPAVLNANVVFALCPGSCPPNTQLVPDAGT